MNKILVLFFGFMLILPMSAYSVTSTAMCTDITDLEVSKNTDGTFDIMLRVPEVGGTDRLLRIYFSGSNLETRALEVANNLKTCFSATFYHPAPQPNQISIVSTYRIKLKPTPISRPPVIRK